MTDYASQPTSAAAATDQTTKPVQTVDDFISQARARFKIASDAEATWRSEALEDLKFLSGDQWLADTIAARKEQSRPVMTINRLASLKSQIVNEQRAQRPGIRVYPVGNGADIRKAEARQGLIRHIEVRSDAEVAYDTGFDSMVGCGKGYIELCRDYLYGNTFDQEIFIRRVKNVFTIYCDPASVEPDECDANWKFKVCDYPIEEYREKWPNSKMASLKDFAAVGNEHPQWATNTTVRVAEYWHKEWEDSTLYMLKSGEILDEQELAIRGSGGMAIETTKSRKYKKCRIQCDVINALEALDSYVWPGKIGYIPLIPILGEDYDINGKRKLFGIVRNAKDQQRMINYMRSGAAEMIALAPKAPWVGWKGQFKDGRWATSNTVNWAFLEADFPINPPPNLAISLPQRNITEPPVQALLAMCQAMDADLKAVTGLYEPSLGQSKTDQSGKAIDLLQRQGGLTHLNYTDNLSRSLRAVGRAILDAAPFIYDAPRVQRIIKPDRTVQHVVMHAGREDAAQKLAGDEDIDDIFDLGVGDYDVVIEIGLAYETKRQEAFQMQTTMAQAFPDLYKIAGDIIISNSDMPGAQDIAGRIRKTMPPQLLEDSGSDPDVQIQKLTSQLTHAQQVNQELMKHNSTLMDAIKTEQVQANTKIEVAKIQAAAQVEVAGLGAKLDIAKLDFQKFELMHTSAHERAMAEMAPAVTPAAPEGDGNADNGDQQ